MHCNITQATTVKDWVRVLRHTTPPLTHINFFSIVGIAWCGHLSNPLPYLFWLCHHYQRSLFFFFSFLTQTFLCFYCQAWPAARFGQWMWGKISKQHVGHALRWHCEIGNARDRILHPFSQAVNVIQVNWKKEGERKIGEKNALQIM